MTASWPPSTRSDSAIRRNRIPCEELNDVSGAIAWHHVMWYATLEIMPLSNMSLWCHEEWCIEMSDQIVMGQPFVAGSFEFLKNVLHHLGFKPLSDSDTEVAGFDVIWSYICFDGWWHRFHYSSHCEGVWPWTLVPSIHTTVRLPLSVPLFICRDQISGENRALSMRRNEKFSECHLMPGMLCVGFPKHLTCSLPCPQTNL